MQVSPPLSVRRSHALLHAMQVFRKLKCHDQVCISAIWHPIEPSRVATCSWDGTIKYWD